MKSSKGFTLIELMIATSIVTILLAVAIPNIIVWVNTQRFNGAVRDIHATIEATRQRAVKENGQGIIEFNKNGADQYESVVVIRALLAADQPGPEIHRLPPGITVSEITNIIFTNRGTSATAAPEQTITINGPSGLTLRIIISITGGSRIA